MATQAEEVQTAVGQAPGATAIRVERSRGRPALRLQELWTHRELLYFLTWRDIKVRYKQTALGVTWALLQPLAGMLIFTIFFGHLADVGSDGLPYVLFSYSGLVLWTFFSNGVAQSSNSLVASASLLTKVYFPRLVIPLGAVVAGFLDLLLGLCLLAVLMAVYGVAPPPAVFLAPFFLLLLLTTVLGVGLWLSALNVKYRDVRYVVPFMTQLWLFATPIAYPSSLLDEPWRTLYGLNPMVGVIDGFRWAVLGGPSPGWALALSIVSASVVFVSGLYYFRRMERDFADII